MLTLPCRRTDWPKGWFIYRTRPRVTRYDGQVQERPGVVILSTDGADQLYEPREDDATANWEPYEPNYEEQAFNL